MRNLGRELNMSAICRLSAFKGWCAYPIFAVLFLANSIGWAAENKCTNHLNPDTKLSRVVGGEKVSISDYPWQISIRMGGHMCGASAIHPNWALTAAHCVLGKSSSGPYDFSRDFTSSGRAKLVLNKTSLNDSADLISIDKVIVHPQWDGISKNGNDIALLRLVKSIPSDNIIALSTPRLDGRFAQPGVCSVVSGWGDLKEGGGKPSNILQAASKPIVSEQDCSSVYPFKDSSNVICAGYAQGGVDSCQGDSGGPLVIDAPVVGRVLVGVVSFGAGCARAGKPGVYTRVSSYLDWIKQQIASNP